MSYKFDSLIEILRRLDGREKVTVALLRDDLDVSERTVYRYLQTLQVAGFPISFDRDKGSYRFTEGFSLKKPNVTVEESLALSLSKTLLGNLGPGLEEGLKSIEGKLSGRENEDRSPVILSAEKIPRMVSDYLSRLYQAVKTYRMVNITYRAMSTGRESHRRIDPYFLYFADGFWHLRGFCHEKKSMRTFALDRILSLKVLEGNFIPEDISAENQLAGAFGPVVDGEPVKVVLRFNERAKPYISRKKWHPSQQERELDDGQLEVRFLVNGLEGIKPWIYRWIPNVEVIEPPDLKASLISELKEMINVQCFEDG